MQELYRIYLQDLSRGIRMRDDADPLQPGEFRDIDAPNGDFEILYTSSYKEPSQTLYSLLGFVVQAGQRFASIQICKWVTLIKTLC